ncbi:hypothetical protein AWZ03_012852, partial [Drosophila navojoa]
MLCGTRLKEVSNYLRHVHVLAVVGNCECECESECETGINMWHPGDDQSAATDMTTKRAPDWIAIGWLGQRRPATAPACAVI